METKFVCDLSSIHSIGEILFVGENEEDSLP